MDQSFSDHRLFFSYSCLILCLYHQEYSCWSGWATGNRGHLWCLHYLTSCLFVRSLLPLPSHASHSLYWNDVQPLAYQQKFYHFVNRYGVLRLWLEKHQSTTSHLFVVWSSQSTVSSLRRSLKRHSSCGWYRIVQPLHLGGSYTSVNSPHLWSNQVWIDF